MSEDPSNQGGWEARASQWMSIGMLVLVGLIMVGFGLYSLAHGTGMIGHAGGPAQAITGVVLGGWGVLLVRWALKRSKGKPPTP